MSQAERFFAHRCEFCGAEVGDRCRTKSGGEADYPHAPRIDAFVNSRKAETRTMRLEIKR